MLRLCRLSYTTFTYKNLKVSSASSNSDKDDKDQQINVTFDVTNTASRAGADVAEVFIADHHAPVPRPIKELKGFAKVNLNPGETNTVTIKLDRRAFSYYDLGKHDWTLASGDFDVLIGRSAADIGLTGKVSLH